MKIKVCGMKYADNMKALVALPIHFMGLIFYEKSPRYVDNLTDDTLNELVGNRIKRVGVFVDAHYEYICQQVNKYELNLVQLHGHESPEMCKRISDELKVSVIKAFNVAQAVDLQQTKSYEGTCQYFLFDTKTAQHGGSGKKFDWAILQSYVGNTPFFLSGGISPNDANAIKEINHPMLYALDLNSKFEIDFGLKDIDLLSRFIIQLKEQ